MKRYILGGVFIFIFTFIALFIALDDKGETYAYVIANCPSSEDIHINVGQTVVSGIWQVSVDSGMSEECCKNTLGWDNFYEEENNGYYSNLCSVNLKKSDNIYYYNSPNAGYCADSFTYNSNKMRCESKIVSLKYNCGSIDCTKLPIKENAPKFSNGTNISISEDEPKASGYIFRYWTNSSKTKKYKHDCTGLSNCKTSIKITKNNNLYAVWRKVELAHEEEIINNSNNILVKTMVIVISLFITACIVYLFYVVANKRVKNSQDKTKDLNN